ncbi:hemagglutinin repeat-containing protein [Burkholderia cenocepacia]|uniref:hemagglutinin repeat-containing protein n=1 Tax=Burkholderia cenocepacia TaxID=95486 RepID=UPI0031FE640D
MGISIKKDTTHDRSVTQNGSLVGSTDGSVSMKAGNELRITGSDVIAAQDVTGVAKNVTIDSAVGTTHHDETHEVKQSGFTLALKAPVIDAVQNVNEQAAARARARTDAPPPCTVSRRLAVWRTRSPRPRGWRIRCQPGWQAGGEGRTELRFVAEQDDVCRRRHAEQR